VTKREFLKGAILFFPAGGLAALVRAAAVADTGTAGATKAGAADAADAPGRYDPARHYYGMGIEVDRCIGCSRCVQACKTENDVPPEPFFFRTWIEHYTVRRDGEVTVESPDVTGRRRAATPEDREVLRSFFVPKLCNHCANPPCVQVCPVGATFSTVDGVVLVDRDRCIGCRYCIQACPYGARFLDPRTHTADKCTFCYHRVVKGLAPACVEVCPTQARIFGDLRSKASRLVRFRRLNKLNVLKPSLNTEPKVFYAQLDGEVR
jgi:Fe-S-cluster-containing dehydrogenase component